MQTEMRKLIIIFTALLMGSIALEAQNLPKELVKALAEGDAGTLSEYFHQSLEITILKKEYMSSRSQASRIMQNFFKDHPPSSFTVSFEGNKENSRYAIGKLHTEKGDFRVNLFFMTRNRMDLIYFMSIEKESTYELHP